MKLDKKIIDELGPILEEEFGIILEDKELERFAYSLLGYFDLLLKGEVRKSSI